MKLLYLISIMTVLMFTDRGNAATAFLGAVSEHPFSNHDYNENHQLVGVEVDGWTAAYFENSYGEDTFAAGYAFKHRWNNWEGRLLLGGSYGYRNCMKGWEEDGEQRRVCQLIVPSIAYTGWGKTYGIEPTFLVLGSAIALSVGVDLQTIGEKLQKAMN